MSSEPDTNLCCSICHEIFRDPVLLLCGHSFCRACWQRWWRGKPTLCPVCKEDSSFYDPPNNLALRNICEDFLMKKPGRASLCSLHSEELKLFCVDDKQPVCVVCLHSETHRNHSMSPIDEAARDHKEILRVLLNPLKEKLELLRDTKGTFDQTSKDIEVQAADTERQIRGVFSSLQKVLQKEEQARAAAVRQEKQQKSQMIRRKTAALNKEIEALSNTVRATEKVLGAGDVSFLQSYDAAAAAANSFQLNDPQSIPGALIDVTKHLDNLYFNVLDKVRMEVGHTEGPPAQTVST